MSKEYIELIYNLAMLEQALDKEDAQWRFV